MVAPVGHAPPPAGVVTKVELGFSPGTSIAIGAPLAVAVTWALGFATMFVNAIVTVIGSIDIGVVSGGESTAENGAIVKISVPPSSWPLPLYGVLPSFACTL